MKLGLFNKLVNDHVEKGFIALAPTVFDPLQALMLQIEINDRTFWCNGTSRALFKLIKTQKL